MENGKRLDLIDRNDYFKRLRIVRMSSKLLDRNGVLNLAEIALEEAPTVDAVPVDDMKEFAEDVAYQFGYYVHKDGRLCITHGGLSTLEWAFNILGWDNPHPVPESECEIEGCHEHATCGIPTADGYKRMCGKHCREHLAKMDGDGNA